MNTTPKVFIIQRPRPKADGWLPNFDSAAKFGAIHYIFDENYRAHANTLKAKEDAINKLEEYNPSCDYILPTVFGDPAAVWIVVSAICQICFHERVSVAKFLYWSRGRGEQGMSNENGYYEECLVPV